MRRIETFDEYRDATAAWSGKKVGNIYWMAKELRAFADAGQLYRLPTEKGFGMVWTDNRRKQFCFQTGADDMDAFRCRFEDGEHYTGELIFSRDDPARCDNERRVLERLGFSRFGGVQMMSATGAVLAPQLKYAEGYTPRIARSEDAPRAQELYLSIMDPLTDNPPLDDKLRRLIDEGKLWVIDGPDGRVCGQMFLEPGGRTAWYRHLVVDPAHRGHGLGKLLFCLMATTQPEDTRFYLWVKMDNAPAIRIYEKLGFSLEKRVLEIWTR